MNNGKSFYPGQLAAIRIEHEFHKLRAAKSLGIDVVEVKEMWYHRPLVETNQRGQSYLMDVGTHCDPDDPTDVVTLRRALVEEITNLLPCEKCWR